ncbi:MAG: undecaprenyl-phosphate glucose phosphotransferase [Candidatus Sumerlaeia bacterium]|nr:undecaprenyl-phosphate glucose phosphotransferase [Candidatus Sumerlaeia bacterium]
MRTNRHRNRFVLLQYFGDSMAVAVGLLAAFWIRFHSGLDSGAVISTNYMAQFWWAFVLWMICLQVSGAFVAHPRVISFNRARRILRGSALAILLIAVRNYFTRDFDVARLLYPISFMTVTTLIIMIRVGLQYIISRYFVTKGVRSRVIVVGLGPVGFRLAARFKKHLELGYELVGFVSLTDDKVGSSIQGIPVLGSKDDLRRVIRDNYVNEVFVTQTDIPSEVFFQLFIDSGKETARVAFVPSLVEMMRSTIHYDEVAGVPVYSMRDTPLQGGNAFLKRAFDVASSVVGLILIFPLMALIALIIRRTSPGPILYKQTRLGLDGKEFKIYKFRTMRVDAEKDGPKWSSQEDNRATPFGHFLRRWNLDELPQLWNVARGDMSLVGPRPERPYFVDQFREMLPRYTSRHMVKTGLTGWAQVHGLRGDTSIQQRLRYDLYYIENWSMWLDIKILILTFTKPKRRRRVALRSQSWGHQMHREDNTQDDTSEATTCQSHSRDGLHGLAAQAGASGAASPSRPSAPER